MGDFDCGIPLQKSARFPNLKKLEMSEFPLWTFCQHEASRSVDTLEESTVSFGDQPGRDIEPFNALIRRLPPLWKLTINTNFTAHRAHWPTFDAILAQHHSRLRLLSIEDDKFHRTDWMWSQHIVPGIAQISKLSGCFGQLADLSIAVRRSGGDRNEVLIYHILGGLPTLQTLELCLVPSPPRIFPSDQWESQPFTAEAHSPVRNGHVKDLLINIALDEALARSIFDAISSAKGSSSHPLERLTVHPFGGQVATLGWPSVIDTDLLMVTAVIGHLWEVKRGERDDDETDAICA